jgi:1-acyl-sn-glycerol-3-phosphate acyltransferase
MKLLVRFSRFVFALIAGLLFTISLILVVPCYFFVFSAYSKDKAPHAAHKISRTWTKVLFLLFLIRVKVGNRNFIDSRKTYIFIANHRSLLDIPAYAYACKNTIRFLAKIELTKIPLMGYIINKLYVSVDRKDKEARKQSMERMKDSLKEHVSVFICPEGTRNKTDEPLLDFRDGAFRLAIESQLPLAILTVRNTEKLLSPFKLFSLSPGTIYCTWSKPIETKGMTEDDLGRLKEMARELMLKTLDHVMIVN